MSGLFGVDVFRNRPRKAFEFRLSLGIDDREKNLRSGADSSSSSWGGTNSSLVQWLRKMSSWGKEACRVVLEVDLATGSTYLLEADWANRSTYL